MSILTLTETGLVKIADFLINLDDQIRSSEILLRSAISEQVLAEGLLGLGGGYNQRAAYAGASTVVKIKTWNPLPL